MRVSARSSLTQRVVLGTVGLVLGGASAFLEAAYLVLTAPVMVVRAARPGVFGGLRPLVELNRARLTRFLSLEDLPATYTGPQAVRYTVVRCVAGFFGIGILILVAIGVVTAGIFATQLVTGRPLGGGDSREWTEVAGVLIIGSLLLFLAVWGLIGLAMMERSLVRYYLGPSQGELLRRVSELATSRAGVVEAVNGERRRIERDLHDGVQQRLVALGMLLGRARRADDRTHADDLLRQAHEESQAALRDLREVTWRVYPIALDEGGLHSALEAVAERSSVPVVLQYDLAERLDPATETVAYFVASEAVTNALKHGSPERIVIDVYRDDSWLVTRVRDDGDGGAQPTGTGLSGLARRVAAADGEFRVDSPLGGPTVVSARLPCG